jgi:UDP-glucuronate decarboxylase
VPGTRLSHLQRYEQIVDGTKIYLNLLTTGIRRLLLASSGAIYGSQPAEMTAMSGDWSGNLPLAEPGNSYGQANRASEYLCKLYGDQYELECVIARCFAFVGPDLPRAS